MPVRLPLCNPKRNPMKTSDAIVPLVTNSLARVKAHFRCERQVSLKLRVVARIRNAPNCLREWDGNRRRRGYGSVARMGHEALIGWQDYRGDQLEHEGKSSGSFARAIEVRSRHARPRVGMSPLRAQVKSTGARKGRCGSRSGRAGPSENRRVVNCSRLHPPGAVLAWGEQ